MYNYEANRIFFVVTIQKLCQRFFRVTISPHACHRLRPRFLAPCSAQTPPCTTCLLYPFWLQRFPLAPCLTQTPPCWARLPHPSWLQRFTLAPCLALTPPCWARLPHPSWHRLQENGEDLSLKISLIVYSFLRLGCITRVCFSLCGMLSTIEREFEITVFKRSRKRELL